MKKKQKSKTISGCWGICDYPHKCEECGSVLVQCPREGHPNSGFWELEREDGLVLKICPNNCLE